MKGKVVVISVTAKGDPVGCRVVDALKSFFQSECIHLMKSAEVKAHGFKKSVEDAFGKYDSIVFISSTGIAVRGIGNLMKSKTTDPAVVVVDCTGKFAISLLSGHLGGANELTHIIGEGIDAVPVITTATDNLGICAPDMVAKENNLIIHDMKVCKEIAAFLVNNKKVVFIDHDNKISTPKGYLNHEQGKNSEEPVYGAVIVGNPVEVDDMLDQIKWVDNNEKTVLYLMKKDIILGIGCRRDFSKEKMIRTVEEKLHQYNIDKRRVKEIASIDIKKDEKCILELAEYLQCPFRTYSKEEIRTVHLKYEGSDFVEKITGVRCVAEPVIELYGGDIIHHKEKLEGMTLAIGKIKINGELRM
ncbi:cobalt-precorrin 5A hydrolase [Oceanirhabdus sp. W0125-5]|uniref:cobalt-precorrin 5A hydrolase n=1 Tax=Oceanirhabdus sp. W0125-5 TaxID=2999116 RepID=UPI0022F2DF0C|nr:cobalt-precorrin 5A hydrolase [Oceanirhabdus sp. W0125-5]WBW96177.1 cobalt-precorrin 5A hydrolase [Oceanirhabdus sp. W0125-5]